MKTKNPLPLRQHVKDAIENYLAHLENHSPQNVYELVQKEMEIGLFESILKHTNGNQTIAAKILGISRGTLIRKLKAYDL